jgi:hypothetical protein
MIRDSRETINSWRKGRLCGLGGAKVSRYQLKRAWHEAAGGSEEAT